MLFLFPPTSRSASFRRRLSMRIPTLLASGLLAAISLTAVHAEALAAEPPPVVIGDKPAFRTEEEWMAQQVAQYLADFGRLGTTATDLKPVLIQKLPTLGGASSYELSHDGDKEKISVETGIWKPETYRPWALKVLPKSDPASPNQSARSALSASSRPI